MQNVGAIVMLNIRQFAFLMGDISLFTGTRIENRVHPQIFQIPNTSNKFADIKIFSSHLQIY